MTTNWNDYIEYLLRINPTDGSDLALSKLSPASVLFLLRNWAARGRRLPPRLEYSHSGWKIGRYKFAELGDVVPQAVDLKAKRGKLLIPMKCPGSKCWFLSHARKFLCDWRPAVIIEPFAGSAVTGLTLLSEGYTQRLVLAELDDRRIAFWRRAFEPDFADFVEDWAAKALALPVEERHHFVLDSLKKFEHNDLGMWALVKSRVARDGKMDGGLMKKGDNEKGLMCRWRIDMVSMLRRIYDLRDSIEVRHQDGLKVLRELDSPSNYAFVDPPYSAGESSQGSSLYRNHTLNHTSLFWLVSQWQGRWQMTYDLCWETLGCGRKRYLLHPEAEPWKSMQVRFQKVPMRTGNNRRAYELLVTSRREKSA